MKIKFKNIFSLILNKRRSRNAVEIENKITGKKIKIKKIYDAKEDTDKENFCDEKKYYYQNLKKKRAGASNKKLNINIKEKVKSFFKDKKKLLKGYYLLFFAMISLSVISVKLAAKSYIKSEKENYESFVEDKNKKEENIATKVTPVSSNLDKKVDVKDGKNETIKTNAIIKEANNKVEIKKEKPKKLAVKPLNFSKPLSGEIIKIFSPDKVIYSKTLELWKTHEGIDIKANISDSVKSIEKGIVEKVYEDAFYGETIVIDHGQGYKSSYSNLDKDVYVKEKQSIIKGKVIGKVSNSSIGEIKDEPHIHFMLLKDNNIIDPTYIFK
ncbi:MAG: M23 family metallopeptidase [Clostridia bacterium]